MAILSGIYCWKSISLICSLFFFPSVFFCQLVANRIYCRKKKYSVTNKRVFTLFVKKNKLCEHSLWMSFMCRFIRQCRLKRVYTKEEGKERKNGFFLKILQPPDTLILFFFKLRIYYFLTGLSVWKGFIWNVLLHL